MLNSLTDRQWMWLAAGLYFVVAAAGTQAVVRGRPHSSVMTYIFMTIGYLLQVIGLAERGRAVGGCPLGNTFEMLQFTAWSTTTLYLVVGVAFRSSILGYFTALLSAVISVTSLVIPGWDAAKRVNIFGGNPWIEFHGALAVFSYGVFGILALTSLMFVLRNYSLKAKQTGGWYSFLPSILDLDHMGLRLLATAVSLLTASLAVGAAWWIRDTASVGSLKLWVTVAIWAVAILILALRLGGRVLSKRFAWLTIALFVVALASLRIVDTSRHPAPPAPRAQQ